MFTSKCKIKTHLIYVHGSDPLKRGFSNFWKGLDNSDSGSCPEIFNRPPFSQVFHLRPKLLHMHTHIHNHSLFYGLHPHPAGQVLNKYWANGRRNGLPSELSITLLCRLGHEVVCWSFSASNCRVGLEPAKNLGPTCFTSHGSASQGWFGWSQKSWAVASAGSKNSKRPITAPAPGVISRNPSSLKPDPLCYTLAPGTRPRCCSCGHRCGGYTRPPPVPVLGPFHSRSSSGNCGQKRVTVWGVWGFLGGWKHLIIHPGAAKPKCIYISNLLLGWECVARPA